MANNPPPMEDRHLELPDLPEDMLMEILSRLPVNKLLGVKRVSRTWKRCVNKLLTVVQVIVFDNSYAIARRKNVDPIFSHLNLVTNNTPAEEERRVKRKDLPDDQPPVKNRRKKLSDLCDDLLMAIFARLPANKLLAVERVSKTWQRCVNTMLSEVKVMVFGSLEDWINSGKFQDKSLSSQKVFLRNSLFVFKTVECLEMNGVWLDEDTFRCRFDRLETLLLINTSATDDADFGRLFGSMPQLKKLVIRIIKLLPTHRYLPGQSLTVLRRLEIIEIEVRVEEPEQIRMTEFFEALNLMSSVKRVEINCKLSRYLLVPREKFQIELAIENQEQIPMREFFEVLMLMSSLNRVEITCNFNRYLLVPEENKQSLFVNINLLCLTSIKVNLKLQFNKSEFEEDENDEVMKWYASTLQFEQISSKYSEEGEVYKVEITSKNC